MNLKALLYATFNLCMLCTEKFNHNNDRKYRDVSKERDELYTCVPTPSRDVHSAETGEVVLGLIMYANSACGSPIDECMRQRHRPLKALVKRKSGQVLVTQ